MRVKRISIKNFIGIEELNLEPGKITVISGKKGQGKTSILEALEKTFTNNDRRPRVIREGADQAILLVETDNGLTIRRSITEKGTNLTVTKDGFKAPSPQKMLQSFIGQFSFNPVDFISKDEKTQTNILLSAVPLEVTPEDIKEWTGGELPPVDTRQHGLKVCKDLYDTYYEARREANADVKALTGEVNAIKLPENFYPEPYRGVSLREKYDALRQAQENNRTIENAQKTLELAANERKDIDNREVIAKEKAKNEVDSKRANIEKQIATLMEQLKQVHRDYEDKVSAIDSRKADLLKAVEKREQEAREILETWKVIDLAHLEKEVQEFEENQKLVRDFDLREDAKRRLDEAKVKAERLDRVVKALAGKPQEIIAKAALPIQGLGIDSSGNVTINGRPVKSLSTGEQIEIALEIAKATCGELKLICLDGIEALDPESRQELFNRIQEDDYQYFVTVADAGEMKVTI